MVWREGIDSSIGGPSCWLSFSLSHGLRPKTGIVDLCKVGIRMRSVTCYSKAITPLRDLNTHFPQISR